jgi:hypothetical protein
LRPVGSAGSAARCGSFIAKRHPTCYKDASVCLSTCWQGGGSGKCGLPTAQFGNSPSVLPVRNAKHVRHLGAFENEIREFAERKQTAVDQAILLWRLIHSVIIRYRDRHPEWIFARHRNLSLNPLSEFRQIFARLNLPYGVREEINTRHCCMAEARRSRYMGDDVVRNSAQNMRSWRTVLTDEEWERVREKCYDIAQHFFSSEEMPAIGLATGA